MGVSILLGTYRLPPPNPRRLRPECDFAIGLPEMKWRPSRIRGGQGGSGRLVCDIPIGRDDTGGSAVWDLYREWPYPRKNCQKSIKISNKKIKFGLNGSFRGALELGNSGNGVKKIGKSHGDNRF